MANSCLPFPAEIRERIYELVLATTMEGYDDEDCCEITSLFIPPGGTLDDAVPTPLDLSLLLVSRRTYREAFDVFYRINRLEISDTDVLYTFLMNIGPERRNSITDISFGFDGNRKREALELLKSCTNLIFLEVQLFTNRMPDDEFEMLRQIRGIYDVRFCWPTDPMQSPGDRRSDLDGLREIMMGPKDQEH